MSTKPKIVLLCHNQMAIPTLRQLWQEGLLSAVAVPDLHEFIHQPFKELARQLNVPFISLNNDTYREELYSTIDKYQPDAVFVISFPWRIPVSTLPPCPYGILNFHGGLLPEMRGSDPMFECIRKNISLTGVTVHQVDEGMDTGAIVMQEQLSINQETTHGMLSAQIAYTCEKLSGQLVADISAGKPFTLTPQDEEKAFYIPKPTQDSTFINWQEMTATEIKALVNACNPQLKGATAIFNGWKFGITHVTEINFTDDDGRIPPGTILYVDPQQGLIIYCKGGKGLRVDIAYTEEGYFPGYKLAIWGLTTGLQLNNPKTINTAEMVS